MCVCVSVCLPVRLALLSLAFLNGLLANILCLRVWEAEKQGEKRDFSRRFGGWSQVVDTFYGKKKSRDSFSSHILLLGCQAL